VAGARFGTENRPSPFDCVTRWAFVPVFVTVTVAPGTLAFTGIEHLTGDSRRSGFLSPSADAQRKERRDGEADNSLKHFANPPSPYVQRL